MMTSSWAFEAPYCQGITQAMFLPPTRATHLLRYGLGWLYRASTR